MRLLIAEDDEKLRDVVTRGLAEAAYAWTPARTTT